MVCGCIGSISLLWMVADLGVMPIHQRLAELWTKNMKRPLSEEEMTEVHHCLVANVKYCWEMAYLENLSLMASMVRDIDWQHEICLEIDHLQMTGNKKKPDSQKSTD